MKGYPHLLSVHGKELPHCVPFFTFLILIAFSLKNLKLFQLYSAIWWSKNT